jgi:hypothetical protein
MSIRKIGTGETGAPLVLAELNTTEKVALLNLLTLSGQRFHGSGLDGTRDGGDMLALCAVIREAFGLDADPAEATAEAVIRADERRKCAAEIRADARKVDGTMMPLVRAATLDAADVIDPDVKVKAKWAAER